MKPNDNWCKATRTKWLVGRWHFYKRSENAAPRPALALAFKTVAIRQSKRPLSEAPRNRAPLQRSREASGRIPLIGTFRSSSTRRMVLPMAPVLNAAYRNFYTAVEVNAALTLSLRGLVCARNSRPRVEGGHVPRPRTRLEHWSGRGSANGTRALKQPPECTSVTGLRHNRQSLRPYRMGLKRAT